MRLRAALLLAMIAGGAAADGPPPVTLHLDFTPDAARTLAERGELVVVSAWFYGDPAAASVPVDEMGLVYLGAEEATIYPVPQQVVIGAMSGGMPVELVTTPMLNVNVFTARRSDPDNLIDCDFLDAPLAELAAADITLTCRLLGS